MGKLTYLVIHCTATPFGRKVTSDDIRNWHLKGRGWKQVGYTDMIHEDGRIENLVKHDEDNKIDAWEITNGVEGLNSLSRSIVYVGGLDAEGETPMDTRTKAQKEALKEYVKKAIELHPDILISGHNQFAAKACPSFDVPVWCEDINLDKKNIYLPKNYKHKLFLAINDGSDDKEPFLGNKEPEPTPLPELNQDENPNPDLEPLKD